MKKTLSILLLSVFWIASVTFAYTAAWWKFVPTKTEKTAVKTAISKMKNKEIKKPWYAQWYVWELQNALTQIETEKKEKAEKLAEKKKQSEQKEVKKETTKDKEVKEPEYLIREEKKTTESTNSYDTTNYNTWKTYYTWPRGGCYYINSNWNKTYVDRSLCS